MSNARIFRYFKTSPEIIRLAVMMYVRYPLSLRNVEDLLHERGVDMRDEPRADAQAGVKALTDAGIRTVMLTGDNARTARAIGKALGIDDIRAELLPQDKMRIIGELQGQGFRVAKVGDGINDAPALAAANVGIAMGGGTDVALETADAAALHGRVRPSGFHSVTCQEHLTFIARSNLKCIFPPNAGQQGVQLSPPARASHPASAAAQSCSARQNNPAAPCRFGT